MLCKNCGCDMNEMEESEEKESSHKGDDSEMKLNLLDELQELLGEASLKKIPKKQTSVKIAVMKPKGM